MLGVLVGSGVLWWGVWGFVLFLRGGGELLRESREGEGREEGERRDGWLGIEEDNVNSMYCIENQPDPKCVNPHNTLY